MKYPLGKCYASVAALLTSIWRRLSRSFAPNSQNNIENAVSPVTTLTTSPTQPSTAQALAPEGMKRADGDPYRIPETLRLAARRGELVVFVGAGVSALCDSPLWDSFANKIVDQLRTLSNLSFLEAEQLKSISDPRRRASIAMDLAEECGAPINFDAILHPKEVSADGQEAYRLLAAMNPVFVTTNYDTWLDRIPPEPLHGVEGVVPNEAVSSRSLTRPRYFQPDDFTADKLFERGAVIHLHGSCEAPKSMIISLRDYISHYAKETVQTFLTEMFRTRCVLFLGYSLSELEVLEFIVKYNAPGTAPTDGEPRHYILYPFRSSETHQLDFITRFFRQQCGIGVISYCIDQAGFQEIVSVLGNWRGQLDIRSANFVERERQIERCLEQGAIQPQRQAAIRMIAADPDLASYFFSKADGLEWLADLKEASFFETSPRITLSYLERAAQGLGENDTEAARDILGILESVTQTAGAKGIDNWSTWWSLAKVLSHVPVKFIEIRHIRLAETWILSGSDSSMVGHELGRKLLPRILEGNDPSCTEKALELLDILTKLRQEGEDA